MALGDNGSIVTNGDYLIEVHWTDGKGGGGGGGGEEVVSRGVIVQRGKQPGDEWECLCGPRNDPEGRHLDDGDGEFVATALTLTVSLYDTAGELVKRPVTGATGSNQVNLDASGLASGLYLVGSHRFGRQ